MSTWHQWLEAWLKVIDITMPTDAPEDQFVVSTETGIQYVLENCIDHLMLSLRFPAAGYRAGELAKALLTMADPQSSRPFNVRLGQDGVNYLIVAVRLSFHENDSQDLEAGFRQLWGVCEELTTFSG